MKLGHCLYIIQKCSISNTLGFVIRNVGKYWYLARTCWGTTCWWKCSLPLTWALGVWRCIWDRVPQLSGALTWWWVTLYKTWMLSGLGSRWDLKNIVPIWPPENWYLKNLKELPKTSLFSFLSKNCGKLLFF